MSVKGKMCPLPFSAMKFSVIKDIIQTAPFSQEIFCLLSISSDKK